MSALHGRYDGTLTSRPFGEVVLSTEVVEMIHFDFLHTEIRGAQGYIDVDEKGSTWLEPATIRTVAVTAETLLRWCAFMGVPKVLVSDTA